MQRDTVLYIALGSLAAAALTVGTSGWILFARDRRLAKAGAPTHHEATEEP